jgi:hypothetical protein
VIGFDAVANGGFAISIRARGIGGEVTSGFELRERPIQLRVDPIDHFVKKSIFGAEYVENARDVLGWILLRADELFVAEGDGHSGLLGIILQPRNGGNVGLGRIPQAPGQVHPPHNISRRTLDSCWRRATTVKLTVSEMKKRFRMLVLRRFEAG